MNSFEVLNPALLDQHEPAVHGGLWGQGAFNRPAASKSPVNARGFHATLFNPICHALRASIKRDIASTSLVSPLGVIGCPLAIRWFVIAIVIFSLDCVFWAGHSPHIGNEVLETQPLLTYRNAPSPVTAKSLIVRVKAPP